MSIISLADYRPVPRYDNEPWIAARIEVAETADAETWAEVETITFAEPDTDPTDPAIRNFTVEVIDPNAAWIRVVFIDEEDDESLTEPIELVTEIVELATVRDVRIRLGRPLSDDEEAQVGMLLTLATTSVYGSLDQELTWEPPTRVRSLLSMMCVEVVCRSMSNPQALGQESESLGAYSHTLTFPREIPGSGLMLTNVEELLIRRAVYGQNSGSERGYSDVLVSGVYEGLRPRAVVTYG